MLTHADVSDVKAEELLAENNTTAAGANAEAGDAEALNNDLCYTCSGQIQCVVIFTLWHCSYSGHSSNYINCWYWAARYNTWLLFKLTPKGILFPSLPFPSLPFPSLPFPSLFFSSLFFSFLLLHQLLVRGVCRGAPP